MIFYFAPFVALCFALLMLAVLKPQRIYQYPYFMAAAFAIFILPQAYALYLNEWGGIYLQSTLLMCSLCLGACWIGYERRAHARLLERLNVPVNTTRFLQGGILLVAVGWYFTSLSGSLPDDDSGALRTGITTIYLFFGGLVFPGFAICFYCALRDGSSVAWGSASLAAIIPVQAAVFYGRREPTALFVLSLGLSLFFIKGKRPPRLLIIALIIGAAAAVPVTGEYRKLAEQDPWEALQSIDLTEQYESFLDPDATMELKNATALIAATQATGFYEFGASYWNALIFRFVPAQFIGESVKNSLMIGGQARVMGDFIEQVLGFKPSIGSTVTGVGDSFNQFGYFGCLFFAVVGYLFKTLWTAANHANGTVAQILYIQVCTSAMRMVTHQTIDFLPGFIYGVIFIGLVGWYAKERPAIAHVSYFSHQPAAK